MLNYYLKAWANEVLADVKILTGLRKSGKESVLRDNIPHKRLSGSISLTEMPEVMKMRIFLHPSDD